MDKRRLRNHFIPHILAAYIAKKAENAGCSPHIGFYLDTLYKYASRIPEGRPGLAITDRFGPMQAYFIPKTNLLTSDLSLDALPELERKLFTLALSKTDGKLTLSNIAEWGDCSHHQARKLQSAWALRGWIAKDGNRDNSFCITPKTQELITNQQTTQTSSNRRKAAQTTIQGENEQ